jgi:uncharacterized protein
MRSFRSFSPTHSKELSMIRNAFEKPLALVTGGSTGIGFSLAKKLAEHGFDLILVARHVDDLEKAATEVRALGADVLVKPLDLTDRHALDAFCTELDASPRKLDVVALNAGVGVAGDFVRETKLEDELSIIQLNVISTVVLAKRVLRGMVQRGFGRVLVTSSVVGVMPSPLQAIYSASKAFVHSFAESLHNELSDTNVSVTALMPSATDTNFFDDPSYDGTTVKKMKKDDPDEVARQGFEALMEGKDHVVGGGVKNKIMVAMNKFMTESGKTLVARNYAEKSGSH